MKTLRYLLTLVYALILITLIGCASKGKQSSDILYFNLPTLMDQKGEIKMSDLFESAEFVRLQPNDQWFFPEYYIDYKVLSHYILFVDPFKRASAMGVYKRDGEFVLKLDKHGKGPGEYNGIDMFGMDYDEQRIYVLEGYKSTLHWYDLEGNWLETITFPTQITQLWMLPDGRMIAQNLRRKPDEYDSNRLLLLDKTGSFVRSLWDKPKSQPDYSNFMDGNWIFETANELYYRDNPNTDTLYKLNKEYQPEPYLIMDPGKYRLPVELLEDMRRSREWRDYLRMHSISFFKNNILLRGSMNRAANFLINKKTENHLFSRELKDDMLGLTGGFQDRTIRSDYYYRSIMVPYYKEHIDQLLRNDHPLNQELQDRLRQELTDATDELDMIMIFYKVK